MTFILLNGAFGIGKTTTAKALVENATGTVIYDPEPLGIAMQRLSALVRPQGRIDDFQDLSGWRWLVPWGARWRHRRAGAVVVPMAFTNLRYLDGLTSALSRSASVHRLCLVAPLDVVQERLHRRAKAEGTPVDAWALGRAEHCCHAHRSSAFGHAIDATLPTAKIVREIAALGLL